MKATLGLTVRSALAGAAPLLIGIGALLLTACGGSGSSNLPLVAGSLVPAQSIALSPNWRALNDAGSGFSELAFANDNAANVAILNQKYQQTGTITNGLNIAYGVSLDTKANLYVANEGNATIQEYKKGSTSPTFSYTAGLSDPIEVATDKAGHVFVADGSGTVTEYAQKVNTVVTQCNTGGATFGVAVDSKGDVFVSYKNGSSSGNLAEFKGGLSGCNQTALGVKVGYAAGLVVDQKSNLVANDQSSSSPVVDIIPPPYNSIKSMITGFSQPTASALNAKNTLIFVADYTLSELLVDKYPSGSPVTTLGSSAGISEPLGIAVFPEQKK